jgi:anti-sigma factor RsiW
MAGGENGDISCQELVELVTDYLEAALPEADRARFEAHLAECPHCEEYVAQIRQTIDIVGELTAEMISLERRQQLLEAFRGWGGARETPTPRNGRGARGTKRA